MYNHMHTHIPLTLLLKHLQFPLLLLKLVTERSHLHILSLQLLLQC